MFKYKVSIYLKSGNVVKLKLNEEERSDFVCSCLRFMIEHDIYLYNKKIKCYLNFNDVEFFIIKKWWQRWG